MNISSNPVNSKINTAVAKPYKPATPPAVVKSHSPTLDSLENRQQELRAKLKAVAESQGDSISKQDRMQEIIMQLTQVSDQIKKSHGLSGPPTVVNMKDNEASSDNNTIDLMV